ncbi:GGDEF domain-containing protein [uncultured Sphingomonas sp.]|uniref:GGDEF domain-containing protein n=1 Tax=uncultured Sphingomonas sp. TaxID=158754 RepID=UPI0035CB3B05
MASAAYSAQLGPSDLLFSQIGDFLAAHRLSVDPAHYTFAHRVLTQSEGPLAAEVAKLTDGGVRLTSRDIEALGGTAGPAGPSPCRDATPDDQGMPRAAGKPDKVQSLVAQTQMQVEGFADTVRSIHAETRDFGRDLRASTAALRGDDAVIAVEHVARLANTMLDRVHSAEAQLAVATEEAEDLRRKLEEARDDARRDPLTGLPNRRAFEDAYALALAEGAPVCIALCDIDKFKSVNDRFGHAVGDRVLKAIADALVEGCQGHVVARYGGEEFAILFTGRLLADAANTLEETRETVAARRYRLRETDAPLGAVTFSGGIALGAPGEDLAAVLRRADALLYAAKSDGRDCIKI